MARAQFQLPALPPPTGADLFRSQCATCPTLNPADPPRQGPTVAHVHGRWLADPPSVIPDWFMIASESNPKIRRRIIAFLKEQH